MLLCPVLLIAGACSSRAEDEEPEGLRVGPRVSVPRGDGGCDLLQLRRRAAPLVSAGRPPMPHPQPCSLPSAMPCALCLLCVSLLCFF